MSKACGTILVYHGEVSAFSEGLGGGLPRENQGANDAKVARFDNVIGLEHNTKRRYIMESIPSNKCRCSRGPSIYIIYIYIDIYRYIYVAIHMQDPVKTGNKIDIHYELRGLHNPKHR